MTKLLYFALLSLSISLASTSATSDVEEEINNTTEGKAGEAIKSLLQEKITQKFKEAANEVKGVLVKQLGESLKHAHDTFNPPKAETGKKISSEGSAKQQPMKGGAASIHQNKANRHRKNSGPQGAPQKVASKANNKVDPDSLPEDVVPPPTHPIKTSCLSKKPDPIECTPPPPFPSLASPPPPPPSQPWPPPATMPPPPPPPLPPPPPRMGLLICPTSCPHLCGPQCLLPCCRETKHDV